MGKLVRNGVFGGLLFALVALTATWECKLAAQEPTVTPVEFEIWAPPPQPAHRIVKQPQWLSPKQAKHRAAHELVHPPVPTIQGAVLEPGWRQPYAYGFFGPSPHRHPVRHFGYRQNYTQWTWK